MAAASSSSSSSSSSASSSSSSSPPNPHANEFYFRLSSQRSELLSRISLIDDLPLLSKLSRFLDSLSPEEERAIDEAINLFLSSSSPFPRPLSSLISSYAREEIFIVPKGDCEWYKFTPVFILDNQAKEKGGKGEQEMKGEEEKPSSSSSSSSSISSPLFSNNHLTYSFSSFFSFRAKPGPSDIIIGLFSSPLIDPNENGNKFFNIVIGGWGNTTWAIREGRQGKILVSANGQPLRPPNEWGEYWIAIEEFNSTKGGGGGGGGAGGGGGGIVGGGKKGEIRVGYGTGEGNKGMVLRYSFSLRTSDQFARFFALSTWEHETQYKQIPLDKYTPPLTN